MAIRTFREYLNEVSLQESNAKERAIEVGMGDTIADADALGRSTGRYLKKTNLKGKARPDTSDFTTEVEEESDVLQVTDGEDAEEAPEAEEAEAEEEVVAEAAEEEVEDVCEEEDCVDSDPEGKAPSGGVDESDEDEIDPSIFADDEAIPDADPNAFVVNNPYQLDTFEVPAE